MKIRTKLPLFTSVTVLISIVAITIYSIYDFRKKTLKSIDSYKEEQTEIIKTQLKNNVDNVYRMIAQSHQMSITAGQFIQKADTGTVGNSIVMSNYLRLTVENIRKLRFGEAGYIWLNEIDPPYTVVMHPIRRDMEGTAQKFYIQATHQNVYEAFADVIHENDGAGFLQYDFYKPGTNEKIPKLSYIRLYEPLGWVIGTGVYIDHIDKMVTSKTQELNEQTNQLINFIIIFGIILVTIATVALYFFGKTITGAIYKVREILFDMSKGRIVQKDNDNRKDEIGDMTNSMNELIDGVNSYSNFALDIGKGNLNADFTPLSNEDNLGNSLLKMRKSLQIAREEEQKRSEENVKRNWANEGYTIFADLMRKSSSDINEMSYEIIQELVSYVGATQGGLFIINDDNRENVFIELLASTAYSRRKFKQKTIQLGDGLVGACALEKQKIYITNVPDDYIEIRSGLGTANPESILLVPLMMESNVIGIIELAAFKKFQEFEIEFIEKVSESIAASLYAAKINAQTGLLLEDFKAFDKEKEKYEEEIKNKDIEIRKLKKKIKEIESKRSILSYT